MEFQGGIFGGGIALGFVVGALVGYFVKAVFFTNVQAPAPAQTWPPRGEQHGTHSTVSATHNYTSLEVQQPRPAPVKEMIIQQQSDTRNVRDTLPMGDTVKSGNPYVMNPVHQGQPPQAPAQPPSMQAPTMMGLAQQLQATGVNSLSSIMPNRQQEVGTSLTAAVLAQNAASSRPQHKRDMSSASVYDVDELDSDWNRLLDTVDSVLLQRGSAAMQNHEKTIAVRKFTHATGTRGVEGAVTAAVEEVLRVRAWQSASNR